MQKKKKKDVAKEKQSRPGAPGNKAEASELAELTLN